jgi:hypothetical protein
MNTLAGLSLVLEAECLTYAHRRVNLEERGCSFEEYACILALEFEARTQLKFVHKALKRERKITK